MKSPSIKSGIYKHYKGGMYKVHYLVRHSETLEWFVLYETLYENPKSRFWIRPYEMFIEKVEMDGKIIPRFKFINDN